MEIPTQANTPASESRTPPNYGLLSEIQDRLMEVQARLMDEARSILGSLRELREVQFMLTMQQKAAA